MKYEIYHTCDIESHRWFTNFVVVRVITQIWSTHNSHHALLVCNEAMPGYDKLRTIILATYSESQTGLINTGYFVIIYRSTYSQKPGRVNKHRILSYLILATYS